MKSGQQYLPKACNIMQEVFHWLCDIWTKDKQDSFINAVVQGRSLIRKYDSILPSVTAKKMLSLQMFVIPLC
jgi:hypothetical protein